MSRKKSCCDFNRRDLLKMTLGAGVSWGFLGCSPENDPLNDSAQKITRVNPLYDSVIQVFFRGGPSQTDTFDPKPGSANNVFPTISLGVNDRYNAPINLGNVLQNMTTVVQQGVAQMGVVRSMVHSNGDHEGAVLCSQSFWRTLGPALIYPSAACVMAYYLKGESSLGIPAVAIDGAVNDSKGGVIDSALNARVGSMTPLLTMPVTAARYDRRQRMRAILNLGMLGRYPDPVVTVSESALNDARNITVAGAAAAAFDLTNKPLLPASDSSFARRITLAQELVKAGVPYVSLHLDGNDSHTLNREAVTNNWGNNADPAIAQLARNIAPTGKRVLVLMGGEFGRTPTPGTDPDANGNGRDHWRDGFSWGMLSINQPRFRTGAIGNTGPDGVWRQRDNNLVDPVELKDFGAFLYRVMGYDVTSATYNIPVNGTMAPPVDPTNRSSVLLSYFGLV
jgi:hypothetical protein